MNGYEIYDEQQPVAWFRGQPIYAAYLIVIVFVISMIATAAFLFANAHGTLGLLVFDSTHVLQGQIWRLVTYGLVNDPRSWLSFLVSMLVIATLGRELEKFLGCKKFLWFFGAAYLLKPVLFTLGGFWIPSGFNGQPGGFAVLIAFATLYPNAMFMFNLLAKWVAVIAIGISALIALSNRDTVSLISLLATSGYAFAFVRYQQGHFTLPSLRFPKRQPKFQVLPGGRDTPPSRTSSSSSSSSGKTSAPSAPRSARDTTTAEMDALLDKIARSGMASLTPDERARLAAAAKVHTQRKLGR
ncbi:hypothetical protein CMV30_05855 [Nibricoccus aquaticus]|uniref:DUF6576 domain-containing protein n=1 Tax=Nibricoccus aquaticus TaxID=2576891 RepID=A0A290Q5G6_9BACT|nr:rhomboid family intramembrane serine protease [Nibricoccus aquaticus]ATC63517.1 hypothetical protein CMV30_05855 [Nibricoccus aquaticus]